MNPSAPLTKTSWPLVIVAVIAGFVTAFNIGKIAPTLPLIQSDLGLSLAQSGWIVSSFSILAMLFSLMMAIICMKSGAYRIAVISLAVLGTGALGSSFAEGFNMLLGFRLMEGIGFVLLAVSMPALITSVSAPQDRPMAMAIWSTWLPTGISLILLISPTLIHESSWHSVWLFAAMAVLFWFMVLSFSFWPHRNRMPPQKSTISSLVRPLINRATLLLMASFCAFVSVPAQVSLMVGFVFQGAATGQVIGPVMFGNLIDWAAGDWRWASAYFLGMGVIGTLLMLNIPNPKTVELTKDT